MICVVSMVKLVWVTLQFEQIAFPNPLGVVSSYQHLKLSLRKAECFLILFNGAIAQAKPEGSAPISVSVSDST